MHALEGAARYGLHGAAPTGMDGCYGMVSWVVQQDWDAVGCGDAKADAGLVGEGSVDALEQLATLVGGRGEVGVVNGEDARAVCLIRDDELARTVGQGFEQESLVAGHVFGAVARVGSAVHRGIGADARSSLAGGAEAEDVGLIGKMTHEADVFPDLEHQMRHVYSLIVLHDSVYPGHAVAQSHPLGGEVGVAYDGVDLPEAKRLKRILPTGSGSLDGKSLVPVGTTQQVADFWNSVAPVVLERKAALPDQGAAAFLHQGPKSETVLPVAA